MMISVTRAVVALTPMQHLTLLSFLPQQLLCDQFPQELKLHNLIIFSEQLSNLCLDLQIEPLYSVYKPPSC